MDEKYQYDNDNGALIMAYQSNVNNLLEIIGNNAANHVSILGGSSLEIVIDEMEKYLKMMKELHEDYKQTHEMPNSQLHNDSMVIHRDRLSRTSRSRLNVLRNSPNLLGSPIEIDRDTTPIVDRFSLLNVIDESTILDGTREMDESTNARGFLADISSLTTDTVRSRLPSFNFNSISPVEPENDEILIDDIKFDLEIEMPLLDQIRSVNPSSSNSPNDTIVINDIQTPRAVKVETPKSVWNVTLRKGSNRKISEEIRKEIQRQLEEDDVHCIS